ncbi:MAG TPA: prepilin-type N-terminal cleavage/methylation domain-containing protein [Candidatus Saccharimonadales bacterium]|nr:prepilin-type N-terminal cleavage/methylation domain-containing protein [Candidatus Saccharimonadales bacterium]
MATKHTLKTEQGFTIVELMIALSVLAVLLVMSTVLLIQISKMYNKGVTMSAIQNTDRNIVNDVASALEFGSAAPQFGASYANIGGTPVLVRSLCLDTKRYSYIVGYQVADSPDTTLAPPQNYHALWEDTMQNAGQCFPLDITATSPTTSLDPNGVPTKAGSGQELVPVRSRLTAFSVVQQSDGNGGYIYDVTANLAYGDNDLLCDSGAVGDCSSTATSTHLTSPSGSILCKGSAGQEYCATSHLSTSVTRRLK